MKGPIKFIALLIVLALITISPALAQGSNPLCNGLEAADCDLLTAPTAAMDSVTSFSIPAWSIDFTLNAPDGATALAAAGSAQFVKPTAEGSTDGLLVHLFIDEATLTNPSGTDSAILEVLILNDMIYTQEDGKWRGGTFEEAGLSIDPSSISSVTGGFDLSALTADFSTSITTTRGADAEVGGEPVAVFSSAISLAPFITAILADPAVVAMIPPEQAESVQMVGMLVPMLLANTTLTVEESVGTNDNMVHKIVVAMPFDLDLTMMEMGQMSGALNFTMEIADYNATFEATPPESFDPIGSAGLSTGDTASEGAVMAPPETTILVTAKSDSTVDLEVVSGEFLIIPAAEGGATVNVVSGELGFGTSGYIAAAGTVLNLVSPDIDWLVLTPGTGIQIGAGGFTIQGTNYAEGALLIVDDAGVPVAQ